MDPDVVNNPQYNSRLREALLSLPAAPFFDTIVRQPPLDEDQLDASDNLEEFEPLS